MRRLRLLSIACLILALGCNDFDWGPKQMGRGNMSSEVRELQLGRNLYATYCVGCHGETGDGAGPAARFLNPKPRDFRLGKIKFAAVASGESPRIEDYDRIISHGLSGTAMPSFALLSDTERFAVITYIRTFYPEWRTDRPGAAVALGKDPWADEPVKGVEAGKRAYHGAAKCWSCHPAYTLVAEIRQINEAEGQAEVEVRPNLYEADLKDSDWGAPILPPDFLIDRVKNGIEVNQLVQIIAAGVGGTAMPMWAGALTDEQLWGLAHYVRSVALWRGSPEGGALKQRLLSQAPAKVPTETKPDQ